jgi:hypothetical protein
MKCITAVRPIALLSLANGSLIRLVNYFLMYPETRESDLNSWVSTPSYVDGA